MTVLRTNERASNGHTTIPSNWEFLHGEFWEETIEQSAYKRLCWFRYVDDTFVIWPHGQENVTEFLNHLNGLHYKKQFAMEKRRRRPPSIPGHWHLQKNGRIPRAQSITENPPITISIYIRIRIAILLINNQSSLPWYTGRKVSVTRIPSFKN
jgi:hypothetical protein